MFRHHAHRRPLRAHVAGLAVVLSVSFASVACSQPDAPVAATGCTPGPGECFSMGKSPTRLDWSERYESITFFANGNPAPPPDNFQLPAAVGSIVRLPNLVDAGVLLVELAPGATPADVAREVAQAVTPGFTLVVGRDPAGNTVYADGNVDQVLTNRVIVAFRRGTPEAAIEAALAGATVLTRPDSPDRPRYVVEFPGIAGRDVVAVVNRLDQLDEVEYAQPDFTSIWKDSGGLQLHNTCPVECPSAPSGPATDPNDEFFAQQWYLDNTGTGGGLVHADVNAKRAWEITEGNATIIVAILDDAVDIDHEDLEGKIDSTWNAWTNNDDLNMLPGDRHGTAAAGIAAAATNNSDGIAGIGANVRLMPVRVVGTSASGGTLGAPQSIVYAGITKAADTANVLSASFGYGSNKLPDVVAAIDYAISRGRVVVFSAGNDNPAVDFPAILTKPPASFNLEPRTIIAVSATDAADEFKDVTSPDTCSWRSNFGPQVTVSAPGVRILTTDQTGAAGYCPGDYAYFRGTSASAPLVAGTAALILSQQPNLSPTQVRDRLQATAKDLGTSGFDQFFGHGRIDACRALLGTECEAGDPRANEQRPVPEAPTGLNAQ